MKFFVRQERMADFDPRLPRNELNVLIGIIVVISSIIGIATLAFSIFYVIGSNVMKVSGL